MELLLVIAIIAIMAAMAIPVLGTFINRTQIDATTDDVVSALRYAQQKAAASQEDSRYGVYFDDPNNAFYIFRGDAFGVNPSENIKYTYPNAITISQSFVGNEVNFEKLHGTTADTGTITITNTSGDTKQVTINSAGTIEKN